MNGCPPNNGLECRSIQVIEPEDTVLVGSSTGSSDRSLDESGSLVLTQLQPVAEVLFSATKAGDYRFEYLYIDAFGQINPSGVNPPLLIRQDAFGFRAQLSPPASIKDGYVLRWRVVVQSIINLAGPTQSEVIYMQMPQTNIFEVFFVTPRTADDYSFDELRVENLVDNVGLQTPILVQVVEKTKFSFTLGVNPTPPTDNYFLSAKVPA